MGRIRPAVYGRWAEQDRIVVRPLSEELSHNAHHAVIMLVIAALFMILIGAANLTGLLLVRVARQYQQLSTQIALGATRWSICRQVGFEAAFAVLVGTVCGGLAAPVVLRLLGAINPASFPALSRATVDHTVWIVSISVSMACAATASVFAAWRVRAGTASAVAPTSTKRARGLRRILLVCQLALVLWLLVAAGQIVSSLWRLNGVHLGFDPTDVTMVKVEAANRDSGISRAVYRGVVDRLQDLPNVVRATGIFPGPFSVTSDRPVEVADRTIDAFIVKTLPNYFSTMKIALVEGSVWSNEDATGVLPVVVNQRFASVAFGASGATGKRFKSGTQQCVVSGVVADARERSIQGTVAPVIYQPLDLTSPSIFYILVKWRPSAHSADSALTDLIRTSFVAGSVIGEPIALSHVVDQERTDVRFFAWLLGVFALMSLCLGLAGVFSASGMATGSRLREMAIRASLGASPASLAQLLLLETTLVSIAAAVLGNVGGFWTSGWLEASVSGMQNPDWWLAPSLTVSLMIATFAAALRPVLRAAFHLPSNLLRAE
jgi:hypothetical protein